MWMHNERLQRLGGGFGERLGISILSRIQLFMLGSHKERQVVRLIRQVRKERRQLMTAFESFIVYSVARSLRDVAGDMAEVGVYEGGSCRQARTAV